MLEQPKLYLHVLNKKRHTPSFSRRDVLRAAGGTSMALAVAPFLPLSSAVANEPGIVGKQAPELEASMWLDAAGEPGGEFSVLGNSGRHIVLKFWQSWCPACHSRGLPTLKTISDALADDERFAFAALQTTFEGFSTNTEDKVAEIKNRYALNIPVGQAAAATDGSHLPPVMLHYRSGGTPWFVIIEPGGKVIYNDFHMDGERFMDWAKTV